MIPRARKVNLRSKADIFILNNWQETKFQRKWKIIMKKNSWNWSNWQKKEQLMSKIFRAITVTKICLKVEIRKRKELNGTKKGILADVGISFRIVWLKKVVIRIHFVNQFVFCVIKSIEINHNSDLSSTCSGSSSWNCWSGFWDMGESCGAEAVEWMDPALPTP